MKILVINYEYPPIGGGGGFVNRDIMEHVASMGHQVTVVTSHRSGLEKDQYVHGVRVIRVPVFFRKKSEVASISSMLCYFPSSLLFTLKRFHQGPFDIVNTHFAIPSGPSGLLLSRYFKIPNVLSIHGGDIYDPSKTYSPHQTPILWHTVRTMLTTGDRIVAQSTNTKANAMRYYGVSRPIDIIPLGIKEPKFEKTIREAFHLKKDDYVFCTIGRLVKRKNIEDMLAILNRLPTTINYKLLIIGDGPEKRNIEDIVHRLKLSERVRLLGNVSDNTKFQVLDLSDAYLSTALHEGFGLVFLEAMAFGLPIFCYNNGGQTDFLVDGQSGFMTNVGNLDDFARRVIQVHNDKMLATRMRESNLQQIKNYFVSCCADNYLELFDDVIKQHGLNQQGGQK